MDLNLATQKSRWTAKRTLSKGMPRKDDQRQSTGKVVSFTPKGLVAGSKMVGSGNPIEVAYHAIASALETDAVKLVFVVAGGTVHFIGAAAKEFVNAPSEELTTELATALPLRKGAGDSGGACIVQAEYSRFAAMVRDRNGALSVYSGSQEDCEEFVANSNATIISADSLGLSLHDLPRWIGYDQSQTAETKKAAIIVITALLSWSFLMGLVWLGGSYVSGTNVSNIANNRLLAEKSIRDAAAELVTASRRNEVVLEEFQSLAGMAVQAQGRLMNFLAIDGSVLGWRVEVPDYTPSRVYDGFKVDRAEVSDGKLMLSKGKSL